MPSGRVHAAMTIGAAITIPAVALSYGRLSAAPLLISGGCLFGLILTPDLDLDGGCFAFYILRSLFGKYASNAWRIFFYPYAKLVPHRSWVSHSILGTPIRLAYLFAPVVLVLVVFQIPLPIPRPEWAWVVWGLFISDLLHICADALITETKKNVRRFRKPYRLELPQAGPYRPVSQLAHHRSDQAPV